LAKNYATRGKPREFFQFTIDYYRNKYYIFIRFNFLTYRKIMLQRFSGIFNPIGNKRLQNLFLTNYLLFYLFYKQLHVLPDNHGCL